MYRNIYIPIHNIFSFYISNNVLNIVLNYAEAINITIFYAIHNNIGKDIVLVGNLNTTILLIYL